jgi:hypothetical protein
MNPADLHDAQDVIQFWDTLRRRGARLVFSPTGQATYYPAPGTTPAEGVRQLEAVRTAWPVLVRILRPRAISAADAQTQRRTAPQAWDAAGRAIARARKAAMAKTAPGIGDPTRGGQNGACRSETP